MTKLSSSRILLILVSIAVLVRMLPVFYGIECQDILTYRAMGEKVLKGDNIYYYTHRLYPYSPVPMFLQALCVAVSDKTGVPFHVVAKLPTVISSVILVMFIYLAGLKAWDNKNTAFIWSLFYALNPMAILITSFHGNCMTISTLFTFIAYYLLIKEEGRKENIRLSALVLGLGIAWRGYPVLLLPFFIMKLRGDVRQKIQYFLLATVPTALTFLPFFIASPKAVIEEVFAYSGEVDYGYAAVIRAVVSYRNNALIGIPADLTRNILQKSKFLFLCAFALIFLKKINRLRLIDLILLVYLLFYFLYGGVASQYLIWLIPFAHLSRDRFLKYYTVTGTLAMLGVYWLCYPAILFGRLAPVVLPQNILLIFNIISVFLFWVVCGLWIFLLLRRKPVEGGKLI